MERVKKHDDIIRPIENITTTVHTKGEYIKLTGDNHNYLAYHFLGIALQAILTEFKDQLRMDET